MFSVGRIKRPLVLKRSACALSLSLWILLATWTPVKGQATAAPNPELVLQAGHAQPIEMVAFSHDGRWLASASADHTVVIWDLASGLEYRALTGHSDSVTAVAFSPDSRLLASGGLDNNVKIWEVATGRELFNLSTGEHPMGVKEVAFDPSGRKLISLNQDRTVIAWDMASGLELNRFSAGGTSGYAYFTDLTPDAHWVMSDRDDFTIGRKAIELWNVETGKLVYTHLTTEDMNGGRISPDGKWLAYTDSHLGIGLWDIAKGAVAFSVPGNPSLISHGTVSFAFSPDGKVLVAEDANQKNTRVLDLQTGKVLRVFPQDSGGGMRFSDNSRSLAISKGRNISLLDPETGSIIRQLHGYTRAIGALAISGNGRFLSVQDEDDNSVYIWDLKVGRQIGSLLGSNENAGAAAVALSSDGRWIAAQIPDSATSKRILHIWDTTTNKEILSFPSADGFVTSLAFSPDGSMLAAGESLGAMKLWDTKDRKELLSFPGNDVLSPACRVSFSADGRWLAIVRRDSLVIWDTTKHDWATSIQAGYVLAMAFSPQSNRIATADLRSHSISVWNLETGGTQSLYIPNQRGITGLAFNRDGRWLASSSEDHIVRLWDTTTGDLVRKFAGHGGEVRDLAFTPDGQWLVSAGAEGSIRIWDPANGASVVILSSMGGTSEWVAISPQGLFDGSPLGTKQLVGWRVGDRVLAASQFYNTYSSPGLLAHVLAGTAIAPTAPLSLLQLPPSVHLIPPAGGRSMHQQQVQVIVEAKDEGGGVAEVRLYQNGKLAAARLAGPGAEMKFNFEVTLIPEQDNLLRAVALGINGTESSPDEVTLFYEAPAPPKPVLYVLAVGINNYQDQSLHLNFAQSDAQALATFFQLHGNLFRSVDVIQLLDEHATKTSILSALEQLAQKSNPEDVVILYFAGHGILLGQQFYFLPEDMRKEADIESAVQKYGIPASALGSALLRVKAVKQVLILDACQSESALPSLARATFGTRALEKPEDRAVRMLAHANGVYLIAASTAEQYAYEVPELGHGVFTYAVLAGLGEKGEPKAATPEGVVTVLSLINYVARAVPQLTEKYHMGDPQTPVIFDAGTDIPLLTSAQITEQPQ